MAPTQVVPRRTPRRVDPRSLTGRATGRRSRRSRRQPAATPQERRIVWIVVGLSALGGALAGSHPTSNIVSDIVFSAGFAALLAASASIARRWTWVVIAGVAGVCTRGALQAVAFVLELGAIGAAVRDVPHRRVVGAVIGGVGAQLLLRLGDGPFMASSALVVGMTAALVFASAWAVARTTTRTIVVRVGYVAGGVTIVAGLAAAFGLLEARAATNDAVNHVRAGLEAARHGDTTTAGHEFASAADSFADAHRNSGSWWTRPAELIPGVGQQVASINRLTDGGLRASASAAKATSEADVDGMRMRSGHLDLSKVTEAEQPLANVITALDDVQHVVESARSPWLLAPLASRIDVVEREVGQARRDADLALEAVRVVPALLGDGGPRRYFVVFAQPAESRDLGGFIGGYGELVVDNGTLDLVHTGRPAEVNPVTPYALTDPTAVPVRFQNLQPGRFFQNLTGSPDFPTAAEAIRQLWPQTGNAPIDGVIYLDPYAISALLQLTGPVSIDGVAQPLTPENVVSFLTRDQYTQFQVQDERHDLLADSAHVVFDKLTSIDLPGPRDIADLLGPQAQAGRLMLTSFHPDEQALFHRLGIDGALPPVDGDFLAVTSSNRGTNKIDSFVTRTVDDHVQVDPRTGAVSATVRVTVENGAPPEGLPNYVIAGSPGQPNGTDSEVLSVMTPWELDGATVEGATAPVGSYNEYGRRTYSVGLAIPPGATQVVEITLHGQAPPGAPYRLTVVPRSNVWTDRLTVSVSGANGAEIAGASGLPVVGGTATTSEDLTATRSYAVTFEQP